MCDALAEKPATFAALRVPVVTVNRRCDLREAHRIARALQPLKQPICEPLDALISDRWSCESLEEFQAI